MYFDVLSVFDSFEHWLISRHSGIRGAFATTCVCGMGGPCYWLALVTAALMAAKASVPYISPCNSVRDNGWCSNCARKNTRRHGQRQAQPNMGRDGACRAQHSCARTAALSSSKSSRRGGGTAKRTLPLGTRGPCPMFTTDPAIALPAVRTTRSEHTQREPRCVYADPAARPTFLRQRGSILGDNVMQALLDDA